MKNTLTLITILIITLNAFSQSNDDLKYEELLEKNPFNKMYPKLIASESADYFVEWNKLFSEGPIATKEARLAAISASAAMRCEYCIMAQIFFAKKAGATDDEIKAAVQIAAEIARFSTLLYGNEFSEEELKKVIGME